MKLDSRLDWRKIQNLSSSCTDESCKPVIPVFMTGNTLMGWIVSQFLQDWTGKIGSQHECHISGGSSMPEWVLCPSGDKKVKALSVHEPKGQIKMSIHPSYAVTDRISAVHLLPVVAKHDSDSYWFPWLCCCLSHKMEQLKHEWKQLLPCLQSAHPETILMWTDHVTFLDHFLHVKVESNQETMELRKSFTHSNQM